MSFKANKRLYRVISVLLALTVITTNMTAVSIARTGPGSDASAACAIPAHTHTEPACYEETKELICAETEGNIHVHTDELKCFAYQTVPVCGQEESETHTHDDSCMAQEQITVCLLTEGEPHFHDDAICYAYGQELVCRQDEHIHGESCAAEEPAEEEQTEQPAEPEETAGPLPVVWQSVSDAENQVSVTGMLPEGVEVLARALEQEELEALGVDPQSTVFAYDITLWLDGVEYQPEQPVEVTVLASANGDETVNVQHIDVDESTGATMVEPVTDSTTAEGTVTFTAEGFSVYVGTVNETEPSVYEQLMVAATVEELFTVLSTAAEENPDAVMALTSEEIRALYTLAQTLPSETGDETWREDVLYSLQTLPNYDLTPCEDCGEIEGHTEDCPKNNNALYGSGDIFDDYTINSNDDTINSAVTIANNDDGGEANWKFANGTLTINATVTIPQGQSLDILLDTGTGKIVAGSSLGDKPMFVVQGNLKIAKTNNNGGQNHGSIEINGGIIEVAAGATLQMEDITTVSGDATWNIDSNATVDILGDVPVSGSLAIDGHGITLNRTYTSGSMFIVNGNGRLSLNNITIDGQEKSFSAAVIRTGESSGVKTIALKNATIKNCKSSTSSAAITLTGGTTFDLDVTGCTFDNCTSVSGAAIYFVGYARGTANITNTVFQNCETAEGGAIRTNGAGGVHAILEQCIFENNKGTNSGSNGGAIYWNACGTRPDEETAKIEIWDCQFIGNSVNNYAGAVFNEAFMDIGTKYASNFTMTKSTPGSIRGTLITHNSAKFGGGIEVPTYAGGMDPHDGVGAELTLNTGVFIIGNEAEYGGGLAMRVGKGSVGDANPENVKFAITLDGAVIQNNTANKMGGGIYLERENGHDLYPSTVELSSGTISGNSAPKGGGICVYNANNKQSEKTNKVNIGSSDGILLVENNTATGSSGLGGAVYIYYGDVEMTNGTIQKNTAANGGAICIENGQFEMSGGTLLENTATANGGAAYISGGDFILEDGTMQSNTATNGGGVYLTGGTPDLKNGTLQGNIATNNGGGIYIDKQNVELNPTGTVTITGNRASGNGAGIYIGGTANVDPIDASFSLAEGATGTVALTGNTASGKLDTETGENDPATGHGGAVCIENGWFSMEKDNITITGNEAVNGGGVAVLSGNFFISAGTISDNSATANGGGVHVSGGTFRMEGGTIGGCIVTGEGENQTVTATPNTAVNGGGVCVADGNVEIIDGSIDYNTASGSGGGMYVESTSEDVLIHMLSGSLSHNTAAVNGGGMAVEGNQTATIHIGCLQDHDTINADGKYGAFDYKNMSEEENSPYRYATLAGSGKQHASCPQVVKNTCSQVGGGFYMNSGRSTLNFYCVYEEGNEAADGQENCWGMDVEGGNVNIGDSVYHNRIVNTNNQGKAYGNVQINSEILINGGTVNVYGDMDNPQFENRITVDIKTEGGSFTDHRRAENNDEQQYKVHYVENFAVPGSGDKPTGTYIAIQYTGEEAKTVTIEKGMFSREGYEIAGWYAELANGTKVDYNVGDVKNLTELKAEQGMGTNVGSCTTCGDANKDEKLLKLYAKWVLVGYRVHFDSGAKTGQTVTGSMEDQYYNYGETKKLTKNAFVSPGYRFTGWIGTVDQQTIGSFIDEAEVINLTTKNGEVVTMTAQWVPCTHTNATEFTYTAEGNTLTRECSCGGQTITATLNAQDAVYNEQGHPATVSFAKKEVIASTTTEFDVTLTYTGDKLGNDTEPTNAGTYTATLVPEDATGPAATVTYTIAKAPQPAPPKPTYDISDDKKTLNVHPVADSTFLSEKGIASVEEYRVVYKSGDTWVNGTWTVGTSGTYAYSYTAENPLTNYYVEARYQKTDNYLPSPESRAVQVFFFSGDITVHLETDDGIEASLDGTLEGETGNGEVTLTMSVLDGYYLADGKYHVEHTSTGTKPTMSAITMNETTFDGTATFKGFAVSTIVTIKVTGARKIPTVAAAVQEDQIFGTVSGKSATISKDSAFTAHFDVNSYDSEAYKDLSLSFGDVSVPARTNIILVDKTSGSNQYWYTKLATAANSVALTEFTQMGGSAKFALNYGENGTAFVRDYDFQFVVDFSKTENGCTGSQLTVSMTAEKIPKEDGTGYVVSNAPAWPNDEEDKVTVTLDATTFDLTAEETTNDPGLTRTLTATYTPANGGTSKWDNRHSALVLTPTVSETLPPDAKLSVKIGNNTTVYDMSGGKFVIPLADLATKNAAITLQSDMFPEEQTTYTFTAKWMVSNSLAEGSPLNGDQVGETVSLMFAKAADKTPSLKIANAQGNNHHLVKFGEHVTPVVSWKDLEGCEVLAMLEKRNDNGGYSATEGWSEDENGTASGEMTLDLTASETFGAGSYRFRVTATKDSTLILETYYYFIIKTEG